MDSKRIILNILILILIFRLSFLFWDLGVHSLYIVILLLLMIYIDGSIYDDVKTGIDKVKELVKRELLT